MDTVMINARKKNVVTEESALIIVLQKNVAKMENVFTNAK
jgi:hypothetical protein